MTTLNLNKITNQIEREINESINILSSHNGFVVFETSNQKQYTNKLTKTGNHKKNSVRLSNL